MKPQLFQFALPISAEFEEVVADIFRAVLPVEPIAYTDELTGQLTIQAYVEIDSPQAASLAGAIQQALPANLRSAKVKLRRIKREDWAESWKHHFKPIRIGNALLLRPSWSPARPAGKQKEIILDPGLSFGTGQHATTRFCLQRLAAEKNPRRCSFWDVGTGSGILAIAAAKLGFGPILAVDNDPMAVRVSRRNARENGVAQRIKFQCQDLQAIAEQGSPRYDFICANLIYDLLISERQRLVSRLKPGGSLILAGILATQFKQVQQSFEPLGLTLRTTRILREWQSGHFIKKTA